jgi:hypothetical protein
MKKSIFIFIFIWAVNYSYAQEVNYNNLSKEYTDIAFQALNKVTPVTKKWFGDVALQHPAGSFNNSWAKEKLKEKFTITDINQMGDLFILMMAYRRTVNKDVRQERRMTVTTNATDSITNSNKLAADKNKIDQMKKEAAEKQNNKMEAANVNLTAGIAAGSTAIRQYPDTVSTGSNTSAVSKSKIDSLKLVKQQINLKDINTQKSQVGTVKAKNEKISIQKVSNKKILDQLELLKKCTHI